MSYPTPCRENQNKQSTDKNVSPSDAVTDHGKFILDRPKTELTGSFIPTCSLWPIFPILFSRWVRNKCVT